MREPVRFILEYFRYACRGSAAYYAWLGFLLALCLCWSYGTYQQVTQGLVVTGLTDQVSWGLYTANFIFLVGVAASAVTVLFPAYVYQFGPLKKVVVLGEILAIAAVSTSVLFILFHMGRPDRLWHMLPVIGIFNFPDALLAWDTLALTGYFFINLIAASYYLYAQYANKKRNNRFYLPLIFLSIFWAISIHTITAFLLSTLPARPMWHHSILPIRFIASAFVSGPALLILIFMVIRNKTTLWIENKAIDLLSTIVVASLTLTLFLTFSEIVTGLYHPTEHSAGLHYLIFNHPEWGGLALWFRASLLSLSLGWLALIFPRTRKNYRLLPIFLVLIIFGIWIEKGVVLVIPAAIPTPIGEYSHYTPTLIEIINSLGNWAIGLLLLTLLSKGAIGVLSGALRQEEPSPAGVSSHA